MGPRISAPSTAEAPVDEAEAPDGQEDPGLDPEGEERCGSEGEGEGRCGSEREENACDHERRR